MGASQASRANDDRLFPLDKWSLQKMVFGSLGGHPVWWAEAGVRLALRELTSWYFSFLIWKMGNALTLILKGFL